MNTAPTYTVTIDGVSRDVTGHYSDLVRDLASVPTPSEVVVSHQGRPLCKVYDAQVVSL